MDKRIIQALVIGGGVLFLAIQWVPKIFGSKSRATQVVENIKTQVNEKVESSPIARTLKGDDAIFDEIERQMREITKKVTDKGFYTAEGLRDPFEDFFPHPEVESEQESVADDESEYFQMEEDIYGVEEPIQESPVDVIVNGVMWGGSDPIAIIDNYVYSVGETIESGEELTSFGDVATVLHVGPMGVTIEYNGITTILPVQKSESDSRPTMR